MEIIVVLVFVIALAAWVYYRRILDADSDQNTQNSAPYKIETPPVVGKPADDRVETVSPLPSTVEAKRCGCGRSASGFCVGLHQLTPKQWADHPDNPRKPAPPAKKTAIKKTTKKTPPPTVVVEKTTPAKKTTVKKPKA